MSGPVMKLRVSPTDIASASSVEPPRGARTEASRSFAVLGSAILDQMCRRGRLAVHSRRALPYVLATARGRIAVSVMVSTVAGGTANKHMLVPVSSLATPPMATGHVIVCAFIGKRERDRASGNGVAVRLIGWVTAEEARRYVGAESRVNTRLSVAAVPVSALRPMQALRHYLAPEGASNDKEEQK